MQARARAPPRVAGPCPLPLDDGTGASSARGCLPTLARVPSWSAPPSPSPCGDRDAPVVKVLGQPCTCRAAARCASRSHDAIRALGSPSNSLFLFLVRPKFILEARSKAIANRRCRHPPPPDRLRLHQHTGVAQPSSVAVFQPDPPPPKARRDAAAALPIVARPAESRYTRLPSAPAALHRSRRSGTLPNHAELRDIADLEVL